MKVSVMNPKKKNEKVKEVKDVDETKQTESTETEVGAAESAGGSEVDKLKAEIEVLKDGYLRASADFQNLKRRTEKEKAEIYKYANEKLLLELLEVVDNIDRALGHVSEDTEGGLADGIRMIRKSFNDLMERNGVEAIEAIGQAFNPELHHAVQMVPSDEFESHQVIEEYQKGYKIGGKVIRHSMVKVSE